MFDMIFQQWRLTEEERAWLESVEKFTKNEMGYVQIQQTKPQTLGYALTDSPGMPPFPFTMLHIHAYPSVGLAAWILEKFASWSDCNGDLEKRFTYVKEPLLLQEPHTLATTEKMN